MAGPARANPAPEGPVLTQITKLVPDYGATSDFFGRSVSGAGDVDGNGYHDLLIGAYGDSGQGARSGSVYVYLSSEQGFTTEPIKLVIEDGQAEDWFGHSVSGAGDVNDDGFDDVVIGAQFRDAQGEDSGAAYMYVGKQGGLVTEPIPLLPAEGASGDGFGGSVSGAGDVNGDGIGDLVIGAAGEANRGDSSGAAYVYLGSTQGLSANPIKLIPDDGAAHDDFGSSVSGAGDVNGDGFDDLVIGASGDDDHGEQSGSAYVYLGSAQGPVTHPIKLVPTNGAAYDQFGFQVSGAGDLNGDGYDEVIVATAFADALGTDSGSVYVYWGNPDGSYTEPLPLVPTDGAAYDEFGVSVSGAGDLNGDGYGDVVIGARKDDDQGTDSGSAYVYLGSINGLNPDPIQLLPESAVAYDYVGYGVSGAGDVNGDGFDDLLIGAYGDDDKGSHSGSAYVVYGECSEGAYDTPGDGIDQDCDGVDACYTDADDDNHGVEPVINGTSLDCATDANAALAPGDCDDTDASVYPSAPEIPADAVDQDCDGVDACYTDADDDNHGVEPVIAGRSLDCTSDANAAPVPGDCDDTDPDRNTGACETIVGFRPTWGCATPVAPVSWLGLLVGMAGLRGRSRCSRVG